MKNDYKLSIHRLTACGIIACVYAVLTVATASFAYGPIQFRIAEAMCILPFFAPWTTWGLTLGCLLANLFSPVSALDIVVGTAATLIACLLTFFFSVLLQLLLTRKVRRINMVEALKSVE